MSAYSKLIAAVVSIVAVRWFMRLTDIDVAELDDSGEIRAAIALAIDASAAAVSGFFVWLVPNVKAKWREFWDWVWPWAS